MLSAKRSLITQQPRLSAGQTVRRNAATIYNAAYAELLFHDGRESRLEGQVWTPLLASNEMGNHSSGAVIEKLRSLPDYAGLFEAAFVEDVECMRDGNHMADMHHCLADVGKPESVDQGGLGRGGEIHGNKDVVP